MDKPPEVGRKRRRMVEPEDGPDVVGKIFITPAPAGRRVASPGQPEPPPRHDGAPDVGEHLPVGGELGRLWDSVPTGPSEADQQEALRVQEEAESVERLEGEWERRWEKEKEKEKE